MKPEGDTRLIWWTRKEAEKHHGSRQTSGGIAHAVFKRVPAVHLVGIHELYGNDIGGPHVTVHVRFRPWRYWTGWNLVRNVKWAGDAFLDIEEDRPAGITWSIDFSGAVKDTM